MDSGLRTPDGSGPVPVTCRWRAPEPSRALREAGMESRRLVVWISAGILGFQGGTLALDLINCTVLSWLWVERHGLEQVSRHQGGRSARVAPAVPDPSGVQEPAGAGEQVQPGEGEQRASASPNPQPRLRELGHPRWIRWACSASGPTTGSMPPSGRGRPSSRAWPWGDRWGLVARGELLDQSQRFPPSCHLGSGSRSFRHSLAFCLA